MEQPLEGRRVRSQPGSQHLRPRMPRRSEAGAPCSQNTMGRAPWSLHLQGCSFSGTGPHLTCILLQAPLGTPSSPATPGTVGPGLRTCSSGSQTLIPSRAHQGRMTRQ